MDANTIAGLGTCVATVYLAFFAYIQVKQGKHQAQQKATIDLLISNSSNPHYRQQRQVYLNMRRNRENFTSLACKIQEKGEHESKNQVGVLPAGSCSTDRRNYTVAYHKT